MRVRFWGARGSLAKPGPSTLRYGGNTSCVEVRTAAGTLIILDCGTGLHGLGQALMGGKNPAPRGHVLISHTHWDHIQGIPFFAPLFRKGNRFTIWGSRSLQTSIGRVVRDQMSPDVFPVSFEQLQAQVEFHELAEERHAGHGYEVSTVAVRHPGGALGYRFSTGNAGGRALVYVSDNELSAEARYDDAPGWREKLVEFVRGASILVHDTMYTSTEYGSFVGWGHSTHDQAVELALDADVERLVLFHHRPERRDEEVDRCVERCRAMVARRGRALEIIAAAEGMTLQV